MSRQLEITLTVTRTLRQLAEQLPFSRNEMLELADQVEHGDWMCCPICQETTCDEDCPLAPVREGPS